MINRGSLPPLTPKQAQRVERNLCKLENARERLQEVRQHETSLQSLAFDGGLFANDTGELAHAQQQVRHYEQKLASLQRSFGQ